MINGRDGTYKAAPRDRDNQREAKRQYVNSNSTPALTESKSRHDKGMELYKSGRVSIGSNGLFKVSGYYECDTERMTCSCPDYKTRKEPCKHLFAAMLFVKNRGKQSIENLEGHSNGAPSKEPANKPTDTPNKPVEAPKQATSKEFDRQIVISRLAVLNTATEVLKTHGKPITSADLFSVASQLFDWATGSGEEGSGR